MSQRKTDVIVGLVTLLVSLVLSLIVGVITSNPVATVLTSFLVVILGVLVDLRLSNSQLLSELSPPLVGVYEKFRNDKCELFKKVATEKYQEVEGFFRNLQEDRIEESDPTQVMQILEFLYTKAAVVHSIAATSYGELGEWLDRESWMTGIHLRMQMSAHLRGVTVERIFVADSQVRKDRLDAVCRLHLDHFVVVRIVDPAQISPELLHRAGNALIFFDRHKKPVYAARADHHNGKLEKITFYRDHDHMQQLYDTYMRIQELSEKCTLSPMGAPVALTHERGTSNG